jgi:hypothetical protein
MKCRTDASSIGLMALPWSMAQTAQVKRMKEYQLFIVTPEGCVKEHYSLKCADDAVPAH